MHTEEGVMQRRECTTDYPGLLSADRGEAHVFLQENKTKERRLRRTTTKHGTAVDEDC